MVSLRLQIGLQFRVRIEAEWVSFAVETSLNWVVSNGIEGHFYRVRVLLLGHPTDVKNGTGPGPGQGGSC